MKLAAALAVLIAVMPVVATGAVAERIVAHVNKDAITLTEWEDAVQSVLMSRTPAPGKAERSRIAAEVLDRLITERLIVQAALDEGLKVTDSEVAPRVDEEIDSLKGRFASVREFDAQMRREGMTIEDLRIRIGQRLKDQYAYFKMIGRRQRQLDTTVEVSDDEVKAYYDKHRADPEWQTPPMIRARHMLFAVDADLKGGERKAALAEARKKLAAAEAALKRGEKFAEVAGSLSEDGATKDSGGDLGTFARGSYHEALEKAAFGLKAGEVGKPVETPAGLHLIMVEELVASRPRTLADTIKVTAPVAGGGAAPPESQEMTVEKYIRAVLRNQKLSAALQAWMDGLRARALIKKSAEDLPQS